MVGGKHNPCRQPGADFRRQFHLAGGRLDRNRVTFGDLQLAGIFPGFVIDGLAPVVQGLVGGRLPAQAGERWLSIVPIAEGRSSYNGLLIFLFVAVSASAATFAIHRLASHALRRGAAWDCGHPDPSPATQYTTGSFAQPIRRVFGTVVFLAREEVAMPPPGDGRAARFEVRLPLASE